MRWSEKAFAYRQKNYYISLKSARRFIMQTATLKEAAEKLGISLSAMVRYQTLGNQAIIQIDLKSSQPSKVDNSKPGQAQTTMTPEEEFRQKYPDIEVDPEFFKLVGCMAPSTRSDKDELIDILEEKYL
jgi:hypothetical protein